MDFMDIARTIAVPLAGQGYLPTADPKTTNLLLVVYWGTTYAPENASESEEYLLAQKQTAKEQQSYRALQDTLQISGQTTPGGSNAEIQAVRWSPLVGQVDRVN
jgi:hypothetical protein